MAEIVQLNKANGVSLEQVNILLLQLSPDYDQITSARFEKVITHPDNELWIVKDEDLIIGMATLVLAHKLPATTAYIEHLVIDEKFRGKGYGKELIEKLIERARARGAQKIDLTTRPVREAANKLYQKLGFELRQTNCYRMKL